MDVEFKIPTVFTRHKLLVVFVFNSCKIHSSSQVVQSKKDP